jgi:hypothetical protein
MNDIKDLIYTVRGVKVMLDSDLAQLYDYTTKAFNQQVKNNIEKFDSDFRFQLTKEEYHEILRSKNLTSNTETNSSLSTDLTNSTKLRSKNLTLELENGKYSKYLPSVFTEQGVYMLMTVLKGELATKQSKTLIRTFKEMKDFIINSNNIKNREILQLSIQTTQNTKDIADIKNEMVTKNNLSKFIENFTDNKTNEILIINGEYFNADIAYNNIYNTAKESIYIIDNYIGIKTLLLIKNIKENIKVCIFSDNIGKGLHQFELNDFQKQYPNIDISFYKTNGFYHDRYIIIDYKTPNENIFHCGASSKDAGKKITSINKINDKEIYHHIFDILLNNPILTL